MFYDHFHLLLGKRKHHQVQQNKTRQAPNRKYFWNTLLLSFLFSCCLLFLVSLCLPAHSRDHSGDSRRPVVSPGQSLRAHCPLVWPVIISLLLIYWQWPEDTRSSSSPPLVPPILFIARRRVHWAQRQTASSIILQDQWGSVSVKTLHNSSDLHATTRLLWPLSGPSGFLWVQDSHCFVRPQCVGSSWRYINWPSCSTDLNMHLWDIMSARPQTVQELKMPWSRSGRRIPSDTTSQLYGARPDIVRQTHSSYTVRCCTKLHYTKLYNLHIEARRLKNIKCHTCMFLNAPVVWLGSFGIQASLTN